MKNIYLTILIFMLLISGCVANPDITNPQQDGVTTINIKTPDSNTKAPRNNTNNVLSENSLNATSIYYLGAFILPEDGETEKSMFSYGGESLCYNPQNNSLFIAGHNWHTFVAEISIPEAIDSKDISQLNQAEIITPFTDIKGELFSDWTMEMPRLGLEVIGDNLFFCFGQHNEDDTPRATHGYTNLNLTNTDKVCQVGDYLYSTNDYMFKIPPNYIDAFDGNDLLTGRFRDGGWSGMGPGLFAVTSSDIMNAGNGETINADTLINYDTSYDGDSGSKMNDYSHADSITGGVFISCSSGDSVIFAATHSFGDSWYGFSNGLVYPTAGDEGDVYPDVPPYPHDHRGWWSNDFRAAFIMYDPTHLQMVLKGELEANSIQPYAIVDLSEYMIADRDETDMQYLGGCAYDIENNRLYLLELFADEDKPIVHVFTFED